MRIDQIETEPGIENRRDDIRPDALAQQIEQVRAARLDVAHASSVGR